MTLVGTPAWSALVEHHATLASTHLRDLLADRARVEALSVEAAGIHVDLSRQRLTVE